MRKRKTTYPPPKTANRPAPAGTPGEPVVRSTVATINVHAVKGRSGLKPGGRVRVLGTGRHAGEIADHREARDRRHPPGHRPDR